jgi:hypothetical protein
MSSSLCRGLKNLSNGDVDEFHRIFDNGFLWDIRGGGWGENDPTIRHYDTNQKKGWILH